MGGAPFVPRNDLGVISSFEYRKNTQMMNLNRFASDDGKRTAAGLLEEGIGEAEKSGQNHHNYSSAPDLGADLLGLTTQAVIRSCLQYNVHISLCFDGFTIVVIDEVSR